MFCCFQCIAQEKMASPTFNPDECSPQWMLRCKTLARDKSWSLGVLISSGNLRSQCQEEFIQASFRKEVTHQLWPTLNQDHVTLAHTADGLQDGPGAESTCTVHFRDVHGRWEPLLTNALCAEGGRDDQGGNLTGLEHR